MVRLLGGQVSAVAGYSDHQFLPTMDAWKQALRPNTRALVLNTPGNPTGTVASRAYLQQVIDFALENDLYIISDEVYDALLYGAEHVSVASFPEARERTLLINSLSKTYAMTGWRIGYLCAPAAVLDNALKASQHTITNVAEFVQHGAIFALTDPTMQQATEQMRAAYARRRETVLAIYDSYGETPLELNEPQGAFYFFIDIRKLGLTSNQAAERLLNEKHVALVPGSAYGAAGEGFLRLTTAASDEDVAEGFRRLLDWAAQFK
jgi:aspartate/methionine/tyrosine aminotransferase